MNKLVLNTLLTILIVSFFSCSKDEETGIENIDISFEASSISGKETDSEIIVSLKFSEEAPINGSLDLIVNELTASYGSEFITQPATNNGKITLPIVKGASSLTLTVFPIIDSDQFSDSFELIIASTSDKNFKVGANRSIKVTLTEENGGGSGGTGGTISCSESDYSSGTTQCNPNLLSDQLDIVTWNIENFPMRSNATSKVIDIIRNLDADIIALQEITDRNAFNTVVNSLDGYSGFLADVRFSQEIGFIYKTSEIVSFGTTSLLFSGQTSPFPREPVMVDIAHANGLTVKLINIHLKCCGGSEGRRTDASNKMKSYIDNNFPDSEVIILGDWNEDIDTGSSFSNFMNDTENYIFTDKPIADGSTSNYSYPSWPSHLDHILVTNELCDNLVSINTVRLGDCVSGYSSDVSDHRPVMLTLSAD